MYNIVSVYVSEILFDKQLLLYYCLDLLEFNMPKMFGSLKKL